jgi:hypothetical protein
VTALSVRWLAERDGVGHAHVGRGRVIRTACDQRALDPRSIWPVVRRCEACVAGVERMTEAAKQAARR